MPAELGRDVAPRDHEHRMPLADGPADEGVLGLQIENVIFVDARRHDHERPPADPCGRRRVLQQLDQLVAENHAAGRHREVTPDLERAVVAHRNAAPPRVGGEIGEPLHEARSFGRERAVQHLGIGGHEIRRRERIHVLLRDEGEPALVLLRERGQRGELVQIFAEEQIALLQEREVGQLTPFAGREPVIARRRVRDVGDRPWPLRVGCKRGHRPRTRALPSAPGTWR